MARKKAEKEVDNLVDFSPESGRPPKDVLQTVMDALQRGEVIRNDCLVVALAAENPVLVAETKNEEELELEAEPLYVHFGADDAEVEIEVPVHASGPYIVIHDGNGTYGYVKTLKNAALLVLGY